MRKDNKGFTLLEILLVVAAIAILAGIVIVALNPSKQLGDTRNAERSSEVNAILNAISQFSLDNGGALPTGMDSITGTVQVLGTANSGCDTTCSVASSTAACLDIDGDIVPDYVVGIPADPSTGTDANTDYYVNTTVGGRVVVGACDPEQSAVIEIER